MVTVHMHCDHGATFCVNLTEGSSRINRHFKTPIFCLCQWRALKGLLVYFCMYIVRHSSLVLNAVFRDHS